MWNGGGLLVLQSECRPYIGTKVREFLCLCCVRPMERCLWSWWQDYCPPFWGLNGKAH